MFLVEVIKLKGFHYTLTGKGVKKRHYKKREWFKYGLISLTSCCQCGTRGHFWATNTLCHAGTVAMICSEK